MQEMGFIYTVVVQWKLYQGGLGTGKTANLDVGFFRQGKHREFSYNTGNKLAFSIPIF